MLAQITRKLLLHRLVNANFAQLLFSEKQQRDFHVTTTMSIIIGAVISLLTIVCIVTFAFKIQCSKVSRAKQRNQKAHGSNANLQMAGVDKNGPGTIHSDEVAAGVCPIMDVEGDDKNPDIIPQPSGGLLFYKLAVLSRYRHRNSRPLFNPQCIFLRFQKLTG